MRPLLLLLCLLFLALLSPPIAHGAEGDPSRYWFEVDDLNPGLSPADGSLDRETPQSTLETFLQGVRGGRLDVAAHTLDLGDLAETDQAAEGRALAEKLEAVIERRVWIPWERAPDRPDALLAQGNPKDPMAGTPRRSVRLALLEVDGIPISIRLNRVKVEGEEPVWVFSRQTVQHIDGLYEAYGPRPFEAWIPGPLQKDSVLGLDRWELLVLPLLGLAIGGLCWGTWRLFSRLRERGGRIGAAADAARLPLTLLVGAGVLSLVVEYALTFSGPANLILQPLLVSAVALAVVLLFVRLIEAVVDEALVQDVDDLTDRDNAAARTLYTNLSAFRRVLLLTGIAFAAGVVLTQTTAFENLGLSLVASASVVGVVLGFAGRTVLSNIMASLQIAFSKNARLGDQLVFEDHLCHVERIHFTYVQLRTWDRKRLIVPVTELTSKPFLNLSTEDPATTRSAVLHLDHRADPAVLDDAFRRFLDDDDRVPEPDEAERIVLEHRPTSVVVRYAFTCASASDAWDVMVALQEALLAEARRKERDDDVVVLPTEREARFLDAPTRQALAVASK